MEVIYLIPTWFIGISAVLEIVFAAVSILVAVLSFRVAKLCEEREPKILGAGFLLISLSYLIWSVLNVFVLSGLSSETSALTLTELISVRALGIYMHIILFTLGLITLVYMTLKTKSEKTYFLLVFVSLISILLSKNISKTFFLLSSVLLLFMIHYYYTEYNTKRTPKRLIILSSFSLLFVSHVILIFSATNYWMFIASHFIELIAYSLILVTLLLSFKNEQKKK